MPRRNPYGFQEPLALADRLGVALSWLPKNNPETLVASVPRDPAPAPSRGFGLLVRLELLREQRRGNVRGEPGKVRRRLAW